MAKEIEGVTIYESTPKRSKEQKGSQIYHPVLQEFFENLRNQEIYIRPQRQD